MPESLLIVEDEKAAAEGLLAALGDTFDVSLARDAVQADRLMELERFDLVLTDLRMVGADGMAVVRSAMKRPYRPAVLMMSAYGTVELAVEAMRQGADDFIMKPFELEELEAKLHLALKVRRRKRGLSVRSRRGNARDAEDAKRASDAGHAEDGGHAADAGVAVILGNAQNLQEVLHQARQLADTKASVLVLGETGTGKELVAEFIHQHSARASGPFVPVHCAAIPSDLIESELFGHEKGAFTGAVQRRVGRFESANKGTLFLDEIGEIDGLTQIKLLRFLETRSIERLGASRSVQLDLRLICATHRKLEHEVAEGRFREDLFYRLNVVQLELPALRERPEDIALLIGHFLKRFAKENQSEPPELNAAALEQLSGYCWPGNIRELRNFCERVVVLYPGKSLGQKDLDPRFSMEGLRNRPKNTANFMQHLGSPTAATAEASKPTPKHGAHGGILHAKNDPNSLINVNKMQKNSRNSDFWHGSCSGASSAPSDAPHSNPSMGKNAPPEPQAEASEMFAPASEFASAPTSEFAPAPASAPIDSSPQASTPSLSKQAHERQLFMKALAQADGNRTRAAELLGVSRRTLHRKLALWSQSTTTDKPSKQNPSDK